MSSRLLGLSVKEINGALDKDSVSLRRLATINTILDSLLNRVSQADIRKDEESQIVEPDRYSRMPDTFVPTKDCGSEYLEIDPELFA